jgi:hypothetical protein
MSSLRNIQLEPELAKSTYRKKKCSGYFQLAKELNDMYALAPGTMACRVARPL